MNGFLTTTVVLLAFVVFFGYLNEKVTHFTYEISLMLFSVIVGIVVLTIGIIGSDSETARVFMETVQIFNLEAFLMDGVLCFMLFAGSCHMRLLDFKKHARVITLLSILATLLGSVFYGLLFFGAGKLLGLSLTLPVCLMFGSIVAPTDPIAATSILKKFNLPPNISFIMEGESLLNDGVGVALFVCFSGMVSAQETGSGFFTVMFTELFGAVIVGIVATALTFPIFKSTTDHVRQICASLFAVALAYLACEHFGFSGAIASVVCGVLYSAFRNKADYDGKPIELETFDTFWHVLDTILNSVLYVLLGLTFVRILQMEHVLLLSVVAIVANLIGRSGSLAGSLIFAGELPDGYNKSAFIKLFTWGGLRGGLAVALAMSTYPMVEPDIYYIILGGTYAIVFFTTIVQGMTMPKVYEMITKQLEKSSVPAK